MFRVSISLSILILFTFCSSETSERQELVLDYTVKSDSALFYFNRGWEQIMDEGDWTGSEQSYRKAIQLDPDFLIAKSLVGRITADSSERISIYNEINEKKNELNGAEKSLLEAYNASLNFIISRDRGNGVDKEIVKAWMNQSESTLRDIAHHYPDESYTKAEYIEFLHSMYGAEVALDSLNILTTDHQKNLGFFITYSALLLSEIGNYNEAFKKMDEYLTIYTDSTFSSPHAYYAQIYFDMDSLELANRYVQKALELEPNHIIAQRLHLKVQSELKGD